MFFETQCRPTQKPAVRAQRCSSVNCRSSLFRSHHRHFCQFSLATSCEQIKFKLAVLDYRALHESVPRYLSDRLSCVADMSSWNRLRSSTFNQTKLPSVRRILANDHLLLLAQSCSTVFQMTVHVLYR